MTLESDEIVLPPFLVAVASSADHVVFRADVGARNGVGSGLRFEVLPLPIKSALIIH